MNTAMEIAIGLAVAVLYLVPVIIAVIHQPRHVAAAILVGLLLGWTVIGWVVALILACGEKYQPPAYWGYPPPQWQEPAPVRSTTSRLIPAAAAAAAIAGLAACGSSAPAAAPAAPPATSAPAAPSLGIGEYAPGTGPFTITPLHCGPYSPAQTTAYADYSGLIFRYTNVSAHTVGSPVVRVNFTAGATVLGSNVNGFLPSLRPGQSATGEVGAVGGGGQVLKGFTHCEMTSYTVAGP